MSPLGFVNWRELNLRFTLVMWILAVVLAFAVAGLAISHLPGAIPPHHLREVAAR